MAISKITEDLRRLLDAQNISWRDRSDLRAERTWIPLDNGSILCCTCSHYITSSGIEHCVTPEPPLKLEVSIIHSIDDYAFTTPKTPEEVLEVLGRHGTK